MIFLIRTYFVPGRETLTQLKIRDVVPKLMGFISIPSEETGILALVFFFLGFDIEHLGAGSGSL